MLRLFLLSFSEEDEEKSAKTLKKSRTESDAGDSDSSEESMPLAKRKESSGTKRKAEVLSKLFPKESGKIGVKITTSPPNTISKTTKSNSGNKPSQSPEVYVEIILLFRTYSISSNCRY